METEVLDVPGEHLVQLLLHIPDLADLTHLQNDIVAKAVYLPTIPGADELDALRLPLIKELDPGEGVPIEVIIEKSDLEDAEKLLKKMLEKGDIFQNQPGKVKIK